MGNSESIKPKENRHVEVTEQLFQKFQEEINLVDLSMSGLVKTLDSLTVSCELFLRQKDNVTHLSNDTQGNEERHHVDMDADGLAICLLNTIYDSVSAQKKVAVSSLTKLLHSVISSAVIFPEDGITLSLDEYLAHTNEVDLSQVSRPYHETRVELLRKELETVKKLNTNQSNEISVLNEKNKIWEKEIELLRQRNAALEKEKKNLVTENHNLRQLAEEKESLKKTSNTDSDGLETECQEGEVLTNEKETPLLENQNKIRSDSVVNGESVTANKLEELRKELERVTSIKESLESKMNDLCSKECIHVQILNKCSSVMPIKQLISMFKSEVETPLRHLHIDIHDEAINLKSEFPVMIFISQGNQNDGLHKSANGALNDISALQNVALQDVALVVVHRIDNPSSIRESKYVLLNEKMKKVNGVFDVVYAFERGFYECDLNQRNIHELVEFIQSKGVRMSALETYGLI